MALNPLNKPLLKMYRGRGLSCDAYAMAVLCLSMSAKMISPDRQTIHTRSGHILSRPLNITSTRWNYIRPSKANDLILPKK